MLAWGAKISERVIGGWISWPTLILASSYRIFLYQNMNYSQPVIEMPTAHFILSGLRSTCILLFA